MVILSVDAMGGDVGLDVTLPGCRLFLEQTPDVHLILVGDESKIKEKIVQYQLLKDKISIQHASEVVQMDDSPQSALKNKKDSSMRVAINLVKEKKATAAVSAGNTGALIAMSKYVLKTLPGISRPAIAKFLPGFRDKKVCALDLGANIDCTPEYLLQFALLGSELYKAMIPENSNPRVGLMNIGSENNKGNEVAKKTFELLSKTELNFIGNVEGNDLFTGKTDVIVCDGFVGNIMLKTMEGSMRFVTTMLKNEFSRDSFSKIAALASTPVFNRIKKELDPRCFNGANILGLNGIVVKSHGGTDDFGFSYALKEAYQEALTMNIETLEHFVTTQLAKISFAEDESLL
ncbi:phosphate acyltransferase PlsX [Neisseriaceae bacterium PsAf]|nr:phosphate acyltransferase PlsX [Neisseriaceae bacterium PsAf]